MVGERTDIGTPADRAAAGAKWLDEVAGNWFKRIKVNNLDIASSLTCVIAQLTKLPYDHGFYLANGLEGAEEDDLLEFALQHGFRMNWGVDGEELTVAWATEIAARKEK